MVKKVSCSLFGQEDMDRCLAVDIFMWFLFVCLGIVVEVFPSVELKHSIDPHLFHPWWFEFQFLVLWNFILRDLVKMDV